jgi:hypothetical protein
MILNVPPKLFCPNTRVGGATMKTEAGYLSETFVFIYKITRCHNLEDYNLKDIRFEIISEFDISSKVAHSKFRRQKVGQKK